MLIKGFMIHFKVLTYKQIYLLLDEASLYFTYDPIKVCFLIACVVNMLENNFLVIVFKSLKMSNGSSKHT